MLSNGALVFGENVTIRDNRNTASDDYNGGGGISLVGALNENDTGWHYDYYPKFTMNGGEIKGNSAATGGGVYISKGNFYMTGGEISGNTANTGNGGGVYGYRRVKIEMNGGTISGNSAGTFGGGVYLEHTDTIATFDKQASVAGGIIYGYDANDLGNSNTVISSTGGIVTNSGHAVYLSVSDGSMKKRREDTVPGNEALRYIENTTVTGTWIDVQ